MRRSWWRRRVRPAVVIYTRTGRTIRGNLVEVTHTEVVVCRARLLTPEGDLAFDGDLVIPADNVDFVEDRTIVPTVADRLPPAQQES